MQDVSTDTLVGGFAVRIELDGAVGFAGVVVEGEVLDDGEGGWVDADEDVGAGSEGSARCLGGLKRDVLADAAVGTKVLEVVAGERATDGLVVFAHDPVFAAHVEGVDDVAFARADAGCAALTGCA